MIRTLADHLSVGEIYVLYNQAGERVDAFDLKGTLIGRWDDGKAFAVSPDGKLVACRSGMSI